MLRVAWPLLAGLLVVVFAAATASPPDAQRAGEARRASLPAVPQTPAVGPEPIRWRRSRAIGKPWRGRLVYGVKLPTEGEDFATWDPVLNRSPNRPWRRWGHDRLVRTVLRVLREYRLDNPAAPRMVIGDVARPRGGHFGRRYGGLGHASHQNGLDVDLYYPRLDGLEEPPGRVGDIDLDLAQQLVDGFLRAGARWVFVGPPTRLRGPGNRVMAISHHDEHVHVRLRARRGGR